MPVPFWCLFFGVLLPFVWSGASIPLRKKQFGKVDAAHPREQQAAATGAALRAVSAERNAWEALAVFIPAVISAHLFAPGAALASTFALVWVAARVAHGAFYLANVPPLRSAAFSIGFASSVALFLVAAKIL